MKKLRRIKKLLKQNKKWGEYKKKFAHKQMKLLFSKIALIYNKDLSVEELFDFEIKMLNSSKKDKENMFVSQFKEFNKITKVEADWKSFSVFLWFAYQTSTYWKDKKKKIENTFTKENYIKTNSLKRYYYYKWLHSLKLDQQNYNERIIKVMEVVF